MNYFEQKTKTHFCADKKLFCADKKPFRTIFYLLALLFSFSQSCFAGSPLPPPPPPPAATGIEIIQNTFGGTVTTINEISLDGRVMTGTATNGNGDNRAFRLETTLVDLGTLGGASSQGLAINADGTVIVGQSTNASNVIHAFRWQGGTMTDLGVLPGGTTSVAREVSSDGNMVVGESTVAGQPRAAILYPIVTALVIPGATNSSAQGVSDAGIIVGNYVAGGVNRAFRWVSGLAFDLGDLGGGESFAAGITPNGNVIVGTSSPAPATGGFRRAYRKVGANPMEDLSATSAAEFGQFFSIALDADATGSVVVGNALDAGFNSHGFRWTQATGMITVEDWLRLNGVQVLTDTTMTANGVSGDGNTVVGETNSFEGYIARVVSPVPPVPPTPPGPTPIPPGPTPTPTPVPNPTPLPNGGNAVQGSGLITLPELQQSLITAGTAVPEVVLGMNEMLLHGNHGHPLANRICEGNKGFWVGGDLARGPHRKQRAALGEITGAYLWTEGFQTNLSLGETYSKQTNILKSRISNEGTYGMLEVLANPFANLWATLTGFYYYGDLKLRRGYINAGFLDISRGKAHNRIPGGRFRIDLENVFCLSQLMVTPYGEVSYVKAHINRFSEKRGGFPARYFGLHPHATTARFGLNNIFPFERFDLIVGIEGVRLFEKRNPSVDGNLIGLFNFRVRGQRTHRNWVHGNVGLEGCIGRGKGALYLNAATRGETPRLWLNAQYRFI